MTENDTPSAEPERKPTGEPLLDISTLVPDRYTVVIRSTEHPDGKAYELTDLNDLSIEEQAELGRRAEQMDKLKLSKSGTISKDAAKNLALTLDKFVAIIMPDLPMEIRDRVADNKKVAIIEAFMKTSPEFAATAEQAKRRIAAPTTAR